MKRICHMTSVHKPKDPRIFYKQCTSLAKAGYETYLVAQGNSYEENGVHIVGIGEVSGGRLNRMIAVTRSVYKKALALDCDIYQIHDPELLPFALKLKRLGKTVIFDSHENYLLLIQEKYYIPKALRKFFSSAYSCYQDYVFKKIDATIFPCLKDGKHPFEGKCKKIITLGNEPLLSELYDQYNA